MAGKRGAKAKADDPVARLAVEVGRLRDQVQGFQNIIGRVVFPAEAMQALTAELRALRYLLDKEGRFAVMDKARAAQEVQQEAAARSTAPPAAPRAEGSMGGPDGA